MEKLYVLPYGQMSLWGFLNSPRWFYNEVEVMFVIKISLLPFSLPKVRRSKRIGPHNINIISILFGSILGDCHRETRRGATRFTFSQSFSHKDYLLWMHKIISNLGYCNENIPLIKTSLDKGGKIRMNLKFNTFTYSSLNWIREAFYINGVKVVPTITEQYLTPLALAIWIMDDGGLVSSGLKLSTNSFKKEDVDFLCNILNNKYKLKASTVSAGVPNQYNIYISKYSMPLLASIVRPHMHPSMYYKLNGHL